MRRLPSLALTALLVAACDGSQPPPEQPPPDGPLRAAALQAQDGAVAVTQLTFSDTAVGAKASLGLELGNVGTAPTGPLRLAITGAAAGDFSLDAATTCADKVLAPGDRCHVALVFVPTAIGDRAAALQVSGAGTFELALAGKGLPALPPGLVADASSLEFGSVEIAQPADQQVRLRNTGATAIELGARTATAGYRVAADDCPDTLTAGGACTVTVRFEPTATGATTGAFTAAWTGGADVRVALHGVGLRRVSITRSGSGAGTVTSSPAGIDCGSTCSAVFPGAVTLTATPDAGSQFAGWGAPCDASPTCTVPDGGAVQLTARFEPRTSETISITYAGGSRGVVLVVDSGSSDLLQTCTASCSTVVAPGTQVTLYAFTPSTFGGWSGACGSSTSECDLGAVAADRAVTATFAPDEREVTTLFPATAVNALGFEPGGDVVIGGDGITRMTQAGAVVWHQASATVTALATDAAGDVFALGGGTLSKLDAAGAPQWSRAVTGGKSGYDTLQSPIAASPDGTVIALLASGGARVIDGDGADRFTIDDLSDVRSVAVAPDGTVAIASEDPINIEQSELHRYSPTGVELTSFPALPGDYDTAITYDAQGDVCADTSGHGGATVSRVGPDGSVAFSTSEDTGAAGPVATGVVAASTGEVIAFRPATADSPIGGLHAQAFSPDGTVGWTLDKPYREVFFPAFDDGVNPVAIAADAEKHVAVGGTYGYSQPWIQIFAMP